MRNKVNLPGLESYIQETPHPQTLKVANINKKRGQCPLFLFLEQSFTPYCDIQPVHHHLLQFYQ